MHIRLILLVLIFPRSAMAESPKAAAGTWVSAPGPAAVGTLKVPVEVVSQGSAPEWILIEVEPQSIPEPSVTALCVLASAWILRRKRC